MKKIFFEELILFTSVLKWVVLAALVGLVVGLSTTFFLTLLSGGINAIPGRWPYYLLLPPALLLSHLLVRHFAPGAEGHGTEKIIEAVHRQHSRINPAVVPVKIAATVITIAGGGSAGKEGPAAQIGAGLASMLAGVLRLDETDRRKLVICGISAGFASVFGTPLAGAVFGIEVLFVGGLLYNVLLPSLVASLTSCYVAAALGIDYFYQPFHFSLAITDITAGGLLLQVAGAGFFFGLCSLLFIETMHFSKKSIDRLPLPAAAKPLLGGLAVLLLAAFFSDRYLGLGTATIREALTGADIVWYAFLLKILFTSLTLGCGGSGGVVTPIFFIGATAGLAYAALAGGDPAFFAAIGFVALLAGAANTPLAATLMAVEMFGSGMLIYAGLACVISFFITGHRSIFPSQVLRIQKSTSIHVHSGKDMEDVTVSLKKRRKSIIGFLLRATDRAKGHRPGRRPGGGRP